MEVVDLVSDTEDMNEDTTEPLVEEDREVDPVDVSTYK